MKSNQKVKYNIYDKSIAVMLISVWVLLFIFAIIYFLNPYILLDHTVDERKKEAADEVMQGINQTNQGNLQEALAFYNNALDVYPNYCEAYINMGITYKTFQDYENAKKCFYKALEIDSSLKLNIYNNLYDIALATKDSSAIEKYYDASIESNKYLIDKYMQIGTGYMNKNIFDSASAAYSTALAHRKNIKSQYHDMLVFSYFSYSNKLEYQKDIENILQNDMPEFDKNRYDTTAFMNAINKDYELALNYNRIGFCLARMEKYNEALVYFKDAVKIYPSYKDAVDNIRFVEEKLKP